MFLEEVQTTSDASDQNVENYPFCTITHLRIIHFEELPFPPDRTGWGAFFVVKIHPPITWYDDQKKWYDGEKTRVCNALHEGSAFTAISVHHTTPARHVAARADAN